MLGTESLLHGAQVLRKIDITLYFTFNKKIGLLIEVLEDMTGKTIQNS